MGEASECFSDLELQTIGCIYEPLLIEQNIKVLAVTLSYITSIVLIH